MGMIEDAPEKGMDKALINAPAQPRCRNLFALVVKVFKPFKIVVCYEEIRITLFRRHAAKDFRHDQTDVMVHAAFGANITGGCHKTAVAAQKPRNESSVQVHDRRERIERSLSEGTFRACAS